MPTYYYHGDVPTYHPQLRLLNPGANEIPDDLAPLADECVLQGLLSHEAESPASPSVDDPDAEPEESEDGGQEPEA